MFVAQIKALRTRGRTTLQGMRGRPEDIKHQPWFGVVSAAGSEQPASIRTLPGEVRIGPVVASPSGIVRQQRQAGPGAFKVVVQSSPILLSGEYTPDPKFRRRDASLSSAARRDMRRSSSFLSLILDQPIEELSDPESRLPSQEFLRGNHSLRSEESQPQSPMELEVSRSLQQFQLGSPMELDFGWLSGAWDRIVTSQKDEAWLVNYASAALDLASGRRVQCFLLANSILDAFGEHLVEKGDARKNRKRIGAAIAYALENSQCKRWREHHQCLAKSLIDSSYDLRNDGIHEALLADFSSQVTPPVYRAHVDIESKLPEAVVWSLLKMARLCLLSYFGAPQGTDRCHCSPGRCSS